MAIPPTVLITNPVALQKRVKTRCPFIGIENPEDAIPIINFNVEQKIYLDGESAASCTPPVTNVRRSFAGSVPAEQVTITDPVTGQDVTISAAGIAAALQEFFCRWYTADAASAVP